MSEAKNQKHIGVTCDACGKKDFTGPRFKCQQCYDFDLCWNCVATGMTMMPVPVQPVSASVRIGGAGRIVQHGNMRDAMSK